MNATYRNLIADAGGAAITHIGLVNNLGVELAGGAPAYARKAVVWLPAVGGLIRPDADVIFDVPAGATVAGWRGYSADVAGVDYEGAALPAEVFTGQGEYRLLAAGTGIAHNAA